MKYIIGLGNPGLKYAKTRHNVGWLFLDYLVDKKSKWNTGGRSPYEYLDFEINDKDVVLIKPLTFMNNSGKALMYLKKIQSDSIENFIIIHDDKDLAFGKIKVEKGRSSAGHNGVSSIIEALGSKDFWRIRIGVANELLEKMETDKFVLGKFSREETKELSEIFIKVEEKLKEII